jgi:hypothetical protein
VQLDQTRISVRERTMGEILDLSLQFFRRHFGPILLMYALGAVPLALLNYLFIGWMMDLEYITTLFLVEEGWEIVRYVWILSLLTIIEAPLASGFATAYLGRLVFEDQPRWRQLVVDVVKMAPRVTWCQIVIRGVGLAWLLTLTLERYGEFQAGIEGFLLPLLVLFSCVVRSFRPFNMEIILLERNPLMSRDPNMMTIGRRSAQLHNPSGGELFSRSIVSGMVGFAMTLAGFSTLLFVMGVFLNSWAPGPRMLSFGLPLAMWFVGAYLTVVRFLSYLDLRIRQEGWEVELRMRAEAARMVPQQVL